MCLQSANSKRKAVTGLHTSPFIVLVSLTFLLIELSVGENQRRHQGPQVEGETEPAGADLHPHRGHGALHGLKVGVWPGRSTRESGAAFQLPLEMRKTKNIYHNKKNCLAWYFFLELEWEFRTMAFALHNHLMESLQIAIVLCQNFRNDFIAQKMSWKSSYWLVSSWIQHFVISAVIHVVIKDHAMQNQ